MKVWANNAARMLPVFKPATTKINKSTTKKTHHLQLKRRKNLFKISLNCFTLKNIIYNIKQSGHCSCHEDTIRKKYYSLGLCNRLHGQGNARP